MYTKMMTIVMKLKIHPSDIDLFDIIIFCMHVCIENRVKHTFHHFHLKWIKINIHGRYIYIWCIWMNERTNGEPVNEWMNEGSIERERVSVLTVTAIDMLPNTHNKHVQHGKKSSFRRKRRAKPERKLYHVKNPLIVYIRKIGAWLIINVRCVENRYRICMGMCAAAAHIGNMASSSFYRVLFLILTHLFTR